MSAYYNENNAQAAAWLRQLIKEGHIADGVVDERSIVDVTPADLAGFTQCHFFAGIGGWPLALRLAGVSDSARLWTGSCPCQPFSSAGKGGGFDDERHLWPYWQWLIQQCEPAAVLGEQVAAKAIEPWIDLVHADLEAMGYAFGCVPFPSASVGAPHIRDRAYWVAHLRRQRLQPHRHHLGGQAHSSGREIGERQWIRIDTGAGGLDRGLADGTGERRHGRQDLAGAGGRLGVEAGRSSPQGQPEPGPVNGIWGSADWLLCRDGRWRPVEPGTFPLAHGVSSRVGLLRGYGNAINPHQAAEFVRAALA